MNDFMLILILALGQIALSSFILRLIFGKSIMFFVSLQTVLFAMLYGYLNFLIGKMGVKTIFWAFPVYLGVGIAVYS
jgi:hypothetical protein